MTTLRTHLLTLLPVLAIACASKGEAPTPTDTQKATAGAPSDKGGDKAEGSGTPGKPKVAIGAERVELVGLVDTTLADKDEYTLVVGVPGDATAGAEKAFEVEVVPKKGWKLNTEFPTRLVVTAPAGVKVSKEKQEIADAVSFVEKEGAAWHVRFTPEAAGEKKFAGEFEFAVCTDTTCIPKKETLAVAVTVK
jgi:hypothetical protein